MVAREQLSGATVLTMRFVTRPLSLPTPFDKAHVLMADIRETPECKSEVVVRAADENWKKMADATDKWLSVPLKKVPEAGCRR